MGKFDTHGGYFAPQDFFRINVGGSHEENPNGGVQVGVDQNGVPNLLEENEPVYNDFVYSDNIKAKGGILEKHNLPIKYADMLYSEIADKYLETAENRPLSAIERNTLRVMLSRLAEAQEEQKQKAEASKVKRAINNMPPEQLEQLNAMIAQQSQPQPEMQQMPMQGAPMMQQYPQQAPMETQGAPMMANGGLLRKFGDGTPGEVTSNKPNWGRIGGIGAGVVGGALLGAAQGSVVPGLGNIAGGALGAISGGMMAADLYDRDYVGAALDAASFGAGSGLLAGGKQLFGKAAKATTPTLKSFKSATMKAAAQAAKREARDNAVNIANAGVDMAAKALSDNTKVLGKASEDLTKLYTKTGKLTAVDKKAMKKAEDLYIKSQEAEKDLTKALNAAQRKATRAEASRAIGNAASGIGNAVSNGAKSAAQWMWDKPAGFIWDPTRGGVVGKTIRANVGAGTIAADAAHQLSNGNGSQVILPDSKSGDSYDFSLGDTFAAGGKMNKFYDGGQYYIDENGEVRFMDYAPYMSENVAFGGDYYRQLPPYQSNIHVPFRTGADEPEGIETPLAEQIANEQASRTRAAYASRGYLPYDNTNGFKYYSNGAYDNGYLDWLQSRKFQEDQELYDQLSSYFSATTGARLTPEEAIRLGMDGKFGRFHSIMGQGYSNYLANSGSTPSVPTVDVSTNTALATAKPTKTRIEIVDGMPVEVPVSEQPAPKPTKTHIEIIDGVPVEVPAEQTALEEVQDTVNVAEAEPKTEPKTHTIPTLSTLPRYAGIGLNALAAMYNLAQKPDRYKFMPMGAYYPEGNMPQRMQEYMPMDVSLPMAAARQQGNSTARAIVNSGSGPSAGGLLLANGFNTANAEGNAFGQGWLQNWQQRNAVTAGNNQALAQQASFDGQMSAQKSNALNHAAMYNWRNGLQTQMLNNQADQAKATAVGAALDNVAAGLVGIGTENFRMNQINNNPALYQVIGPDGKPIYVGSQRKCGGLLKTYKK